MSRYYFDIKNGHRLIDPSGLDCRDDHQAMQSATVIARQIAEDVHTGEPRHVSVLNAARSEIGTVPVANAGSKETTPARGATGAQFARVVSDSDKARAQVHAIGHHKKRCDESGAG
jgi:hypothetical protein